MHEACHRMQHVLRGRHSAICETLDNALKHAIRDESLDLRWQVVKHLSGQLDASKHYRAHCSFNLLPRLHVRLGGQGLVHFEDIQ